ncbi:hypothetical protein HPB48_018489 [Haemaphysalis longicornis]|uniref:Uncharacterized protein n=1 Tax=Haemaphysalis longicornis TaxID=44386 RepID=A0A9J6FF87_HAELO|nr:hypothetical protein HPB48_018489 [Haemaphysalis longicornis]
MSVRRREPYYLEEVGHQPPLSLARKSTSDGLTGTKRQTRLHASSRTVQPALRRLDNFRRQIPAQSLIISSSVEAWLGRITVSPEKKKSIFVGFRQAQCLLPRWRDMCGPDITPDSGGPRRAPNVLVMAGSSLVPRPVTLRGLDSAPALAFTTRAEPCGR